MEKLPVKFIEISVMGTVGFAFVLSLRTNESVANLRALVGMRFEQRIDRIVLVFAGRILPDVGNIEQQGISAGVTVHFVVRNLQPPPPVVGELQRADDMKKAAKREILNNYTKRGSMKKLIEQPQMLRDILLNDGRFKSLLEENGHLRHYFGSNRNMRKLLTTMFNHAKVQEQGRRLDLHMLRMESMPGGLQLLQRLNNYLCDSYESAVASSYQQIPRTALAIYRHHIKDENPQRGYENNLPLPNPWQPNLDVHLSSSFLVSTLWQRCYSLMDKLEAGRMRRPQQAVISLSEMAAATGRLLRLHRNTNTVRVFAARSRQPLVNSAGKNNERPIPRLFNLNAFLSSDMGNWQRHFDVQLIELYDRGFTNRRRNLGALLMALGDVEAAVELLNLGRQR